MNGRDKKTEVSLSKLSFYNEHKNLFPELIKIKQWSVDQINNITKDFKSMDERFKYFSNGKHSAPQVFGSTAIDRAVNSLVEHTENYYKLHKNFLEKIDDNLYHDIVYNLYKDECIKPNGPRPNWTSVD